MTPCRAPHPLHAPRWQTSLLPPLLLRCQSANFALVPLKHQLLVVNSMTILDAIFMSWARNQDDWFGKARAWASAQGQRDKNGSS